jgi:predicted enzyme related to lactoylglutathione lyase
MYISVVTLPVKDLDRAINFYTNTLGWEKTMDVSMGDDSRWVTVAPSGEGKTAFTLDLSPEDAGKFTGVIMEVDDVFDTHKQLSNKNVKFAEPPRVEPWGGWAQFQDSEGNTHGLHSPAPANVSSN